MTVSAFGELAPEETGDQAHYALTVALRLAGAGYYLTPVTLTRREDGKKGAKFHARGGWRHEGAWSTDPDQIRAWWVDHPDTSFAVSCRLSGVEATDHDTKEGADGVTLWSEAGLPWGRLLVETPSGGMHSYWRADPANHLPDSADAGEVRGVDTRSIGTGDGTSWGGILYAPGSYIVGEPGAYRIMGALVPAAELDRTPAEVLAAFPPPAPKVYAQDGTIVIKDRDVMAVKCREAVEQLASLPPRTGGSHFRDLQMGAAMMLGRFAEADGTPSAPWALAELERATVAVWGSVSAADALNIESGLRDGLRKERWRWRPAPEPATAIQHAAPAVQVSPAAAPSVQESGSTQSHGGLQVARPAPELEQDLGDPNPSSSPLPEVVDPAAIEDAAAIDRERRRRMAKRAVDLEERGPVAPIADLVVWDDALDTVPPPKMAVPELIPEASVGWLGGPSGSYKSFVSVQLALGLAYGCSVLGDAELAPRRPRRVLYVAGEDAPGVAMRLRGARHRAGVLKAGGVGLYPRALDLASEAEVERLAEFVAANGVEFVVIDTFRQSTVGVNENDNTEVGVILSRMIRLRDDLGVSTMLVDHTAKSAQGLSDLGGAGAKRANVDFVLMVDLPGAERTADQQRTLRVAKLKNRPEGRTWPIRLESVPAVTDEEGFPTAVAVVGELGGAEAIHNDTPWINVAIPDDVRDYAGPSAPDLHLIAQLVMAYGSGESGVSRNDLTTYYRKVRGNLTTATSRMRVVRAWDALHALGRLIPVGAYGSPASAHRWSTEPIRKINIGANE